jgi:hypothetical protein
MKSMLDQAIAGRGENRPLRKAQPAAIVFCDAQAAPEVSTLFSGRFS